MLTNEDAACDPLHQRPAPAALTFRVGPTYDIYMHGEGITVTVRPKVDAARLALMLRGLVPQALALGADISWSESQTIETPDGAVRVGVAGEVIPEVAALLLLHAADAIARTGIPGSDETLVLLDPDGRAYEAHSHGLDSFEYCDRSKLEVLLRRNGL